MRTLVTLFLCGIPWLACGGAVAETIHLKNGRSIWADQVREKGDRVEYDIGDDSYAIPKSSVESIETGGAPQSVSSAADGTSNTKTPPNVASFLPSTDLKTASDLAAKIIHDGQIDAEALGALEQAGNADATAAGYFLAGKHEFDRGNLTQARIYFESALRFDSQNPTILEFYSALLVKSGSATQALPYAEHAVRIAPNSPDALDILGYAQFASDHSRDAVRTWKRSLQLRPDSVLEQYIDKAERESSAEANFSEGESSHFTLRYEGKATSDQLRRELIATLEAEYDALVSDFGIAPRNNIPVILYTGQAFFDVTQAPSWSGAVNDGKLRIPVQGLTSVTPDLARVLKHELAHSFINQLAAGRCPQWLNEGIAQLLEPKSVSSNGRRLAALFQSQHELPFNSLEGSFMRFSSVEAMLAYDESLAVVEYINQTYGMSDLRTILERLGQGSSTESALRATIHSDYAQLDGEVGKYLIDKYGG